MLAHAFASRVAIAIVAIVIATSGGPPSAYADAHEKTGVERLWSKFPLGPRLQIPRAKQTRHRATPPPATSATAASPRVSAAKPAESRRTPLWLWPVIIVVALVLASAAFWLLRRRHGTGQPVVRSVPQEEPPPVRRLADPVQASVAPPQEKHPWTSGAPRSLETLPRRELFEMANALGIEDTVLMSPEELVDALRARGPGAGTAAAEASDLELARYAAAYAAACRSGNPAPVLALSAIVPRTTEDPAGYSKQKIAEARRRGLLTTHGRGKAGGELTAQSKIVLRHWARDHPQSARQ